MAEIEDVIADGVVRELDADEAPAAPVGTFAPGAGPGTSSWNYGGPGTSQTGGHVTDLNGGSATTPGVPYTIPGGAVEDTGNAGGRRGPAGPSKEARGSHCADEDCPVRGGVREFPRVLFKGPSPGNRPRRWTFNISKLSTKGKKR